MLAGNRYSGTESAAAGDTSEFATESRRITASSTKKKGSVQTIGDVSSIVTNVVRLSKQTSAFGRRES